jgi:protein involved in sex pheromone biosynthesis
MKRIILLLISLALVIFAKGCSKENQSQIGNTPSNAKSKAMQVEAQMLLKQIHTMQNAYYKTSKSYTDNLIDMGMTLPANVKYSYHVNLNESGWTCSATANLDNDDTIDRWIVDQSGRIHCSTDDATS